jgi:DNA polymerase-3 subunit gamma/tau
VVTALYRRYRPENFAELIGQTQVTDPLMTALRTDRVNHAYLFSGPRGCGKTTSARILARCLNCVEGPTDTPCGTCASCVELSRDGSGSLDVVEIDAASHGGVDDARDLRERAIFAPARDRYKIFILDEAHMVTTTGFNALLKIVEEPPEHVMFIFATTEPEKVIGTIRSRTHHYPFRLVPPAQMLEYVQQLAESEGVQVEAGVLPLVVRAGGGSVRDTLSLLDQLIAGSDGPSVQYERAVALLGYTHATLLGEVIEALGSKAASAAFAAVDRVIQTGQDPRRFVEDLLERLRDLIVVSAFPPGTGSHGASAVLRGVQQDELEQMAQQAARFGTAELSRTADVVNAALTDMTGATSPRLHLELMVARILVPSSDDSERGALARVERLERRVGVAGAMSTDARPPASPASDKTPAPASLVPEPAVVPKGVPAGSPTAAKAPTDGQTGQDENGPVKRRPDVMSLPDSVPAAANSEASIATAPIGTVTLQQIRDAWPEILDAVEKAKRSAWMVLFTAQARELRDGDVLVLSFPSQKDVDGLKQASAPGQGVGDYLKRAVAEVLGITPKLVAVVDNVAGAPARPAPQPAVAQPQTSAPTVTRPAATQSEAVPSSESPAAGGWATVAIPGSSGSDSTRDVTRHSVSDDDAPPLDDEPPEEWEPPVERFAPSPAVTSAQPRPVVKKPAVSTNAPGQRARYGEAVVREILGASFIEEQPHNPRVIPGPGAS